LRRGYGSFFQRGKITTKKLTLYVCLVCAASPAFAGCNKQTGGKLQSMETMKTLAMRKAVRDYRSEQITKAEPEAILQAALYAPSAGGRQAAVIVVCQNAELNTALGKINKAASKRMGQKEWGIDKTYGAKIHVTLGCPAGDTPPAAKPRKDGRVIRVGG
jgi:hypothetical protein